mgnify:CR=1 FL=1
MTGENVYGRREEYLSLPGYEVPKDAMYLQTEKLIEDTFEKAGFDFARYSEVTCKDVPQDIMDDILNILLEEKQIVKINDEMLRFYWKLGKDISAMSNQYGYGSGFYKILSADLKKVLPDVKSFSPTNLKYMRYFYELYPFVENRPQAVDDLNSIEISPHVVDDLSVIFRIPWHKDTAM